jgi:poly(3-hydroxybutyrate) depolymerase
MKAVASPNVSSGPKPETKTASQPDSRIKPTASQSAAIRKLREKVANMPVPENLQRRTLKVGGVEREFFINVPAACKGKPAPVVFALHGGASSSGLAQHLKAD